MPDKDPCKSTNCIAAVTAYNQADAAAKAASIKSTDLCKHSKSLAAIAAGLLATAAAAATAAKLAFGAGAALSWTGFGAVIFGSATVAAGATAGAAAIAAAVAAKRSTAAWADYNRARNACTAANAAALAAWNAHITACGQTCAPPYTASGCAC